MTLKKSDSQQKKQKILPRPTAGFFFEQEDKPTKNKTG
jgi:hypothetical protein